ncbi:hypothetical protein CDAR_396761 [Caerostris darwini]|uniref:Uncharacterized protein n=1 Tax=Caerostris darwini TaxID=1538125 RepID=A0AAV4PND1_9ARAC|nr:hypothetical protein CDAR_396761 [Caerostris darwini]
MDVQAATGKFESSRHEYIQTSLHTTPTHMHTAEHYKMANLHFQAANKDTRDCTSWTITAYNILYNRQDSHLSHQTLLPSSQWHIHAETTRVLFESCVFHLILFLCDGAFFLADISFDRNQFRNRRGKRFHFDFLFFLKVLNLQMLRDASSSLE